MAQQTTLSPHNQQPYVQRTYPTTTELDTIIKNASIAQKAWAKVPLDRRIQIGELFIKEIEAMKDEIPLELCLQMGRPLQQCPGEVKGLIERASYMLSIAPKSLSDISLTESDKAGFKRYIKRVPLGLVFIIAPWNFPYLTTINSLLPALIAGNAVLLKPSPQTPLTAERLSLALTRAGLPPHLLSVLHLDPELTAHTIEHPAVNFVSFTGSVPVGRSVAETAAKAPGFTGSALELGGKDAAYVAPDADLDYTAAELVDGAFFNSGQSCCAIERIYVHTDIYDTFVSKFVEITKGYNLGDPTTGTHNLGPVVSLASAERIRKQVADAVAQGAKSLIPEQHFAAAKVGTTYVAPQVLVDVNHTMDLMKEETFGPVVGIQRVSSASAALELMNDSRYGLTASIWTRVSEDDSSNPDPETGSALFEFMLSSLEVGTVFLNRCDYLDPALAWCGVKDSGRGVSLSSFGYDQLTRPKSVHMKIETSG